MDSKTIDDFYVIFAESGRLTIEFAAKGLQVGALTA